MNVKPSKESFAEMLKPFSFFHTIYFNVDSSAYNQIGESVYGRFIKPTKTKLKQFELMRFCIDAPRINRMNIKLSPENKNSLYYIGVDFEDIDVEQTYPADAFN